MSAPRVIKRFRIRRDSVPLARLHVIGVLEHWRLPGLAGAAAQITSELAANAVLHAKGMGDFFELTLRRRPSGVVVLEVADSFAWRMPRVGSPNDHEESGRGLLIVGALAQRWGVRPRDPGKIVWAEICVGAAEAADR